MLQLSLLSDDTKWYPILFDSPMNVARGVSFWLTLALVLAFIPAALLLKGGARKKLLRYSLIGAVVYAAALGIAFLTLTFSEDGVALILFVPLLLLIVSVAACGALLVLRHDFIACLSAGLVVGAAAIATLVCMGVHFASGQPADWNGISNADVNQLGLYLSAGLLVAAIVAAAFLLGRKDPKGFDSKAIAYAAILIAMSFALSFIRLVQMPQGGSITIASLLPLMIYAYMFGTRKGVFAGMIYGVLQAFQDFYVLHPAQFLLDYPVAFACIGFAGTFARFKPLEKLPQLQFALGAVLGGLLRFLSHFLSGCFAFGAYAPAGTPVWLYSLGYQAGYVLPDIAIVIVVGAIVFCSPAFVKAVRKFHPAPAQKVNAEE